MEGGAVKSDAKSPAQLDVAWPASERDGVALRQLQSVGQLCSKIDDEQGRRSGR